MAFRGNPSVRVDVCGMFEEIPSKHYWDIFFIKIGRHGQRDLLTTKILSLHPRVQEDVTHLNKVPQGIPDI